MGMTVVFRVYDRDIGSFVVADYPGKKPQKFFNVTEFEAAEIVRSFKVNVVIGESMPISTYKKLYGK